MKSGVLIAASAAMCFAGAAQAATDSGLMLHDGPMAGRSGTSGAGVALKVRWDAVEQRSAPRRSALELHAGPVLTVRDATTLDGTRRGIVPVAVFSFGPRETPSFRLAGQELGPASPLHAGDDKKEKKKQSTGDKVAWVAAVAGGVMVALVGAAFIALRSQGPTD